MSNKGILKKTLFTILVIFGQIRKISLFGVTSVIERVASFIFSNFAKFIMFYEPDLDVLI